MKAVRPLLALALALAISGVALAAKPKVVILATGGTIAGAQAEGQDAGYKSGSFQVQDTTFGFAASATPEIANASASASSGLTAFICSLLLTAQRASAGAPAFVTVPSAAFLATLTVLPVAIW